MNALTHGQSDELSEMDALTESAGPTGAGSGGASPRNPPLVEGLRQALLASIRREPVDEYTCHEGSNILKQLLSSQTKIQGRRAISRIILNATLQERGDLPGDVIPSILLLLAKLSWREVGGVDWAGRLALSKLGDPDPAIAWAALRCIESWQYKGAYRPLKAFAEKENWRPIRELAESIIEDITTDGAMQR